MFDTGFWLSAGFFFSIGLFFGIYGEHRAREYFMQKEKRAQEGREQ
jgi:hypothetical protein